MEAAAKEVKVSNREQKEDLLTRKIKRVIKTGKRYFSYYEQSKHKSYNVITFFSEDKTPAIVVFVKDYKEPTVKKRNMLELVKYSRSNKVKTVLFSHLDQVAALNFQLKNLEQTTNPIADLNLNTTKRFKKKTKDHRKRKSQIRMTYTTKNPTE